jgi:hypothetical protein
MTDQRLKCCIAITLQGNIYMYSSKEDITLVETARDKDFEWDGYSDFMENMTARDMANLSVDIGIRLDFKKGSKEDLATELWGELCKRADDRRTAKLPEKRDPLTGKKKRGRKKQNLANRRYFLQLTPGIPKEKKALLDDAPVTTRQAKKIWEFFIDEFLETGSLYVTEARMQNLVNDRAEELRTRQDPWRIFQYYRPELIQCKLIKLEK